MQSTHNNRQSRLRRYPAAPRSAVARHLFGWRRHGLALGAILWLLPILGSAASDAGGVRLGYLTGTFDPIHASHLELARVAIDRLHLDRLYLLPHVTPGHKPGATPFALRHAMVEIACLRERNLKVLPADELVRVAGRRPREPISAMIEHLRQIENPNARWFQICGADSFNRLVAAGLLPQPGENRVVAVARRAGYTFESADRWQAAHADGRVVFIDHSGDELSSTRVRQAMMRGEALSPTVILPAVQAFARRHGLYGATPPDRSPGRWALPVPPGFRRSALTLDGTGSHRSSVATPAVSTSDLGADRSAGAGGRPGCTARNRRFSAPSITAARRCRRPAARIDGFLPPAGWHRRALEELLSPDDLRRSMTLDVDRYLAQKLPEPVIAAVRDHGAAVTLLAALEPEAHEFLRTAGWTRGILLRPTSDERIGLQFARVDDGRRPHLVVFDVFGRTRIRHVTLQLAHLMVRHGVPLSDLEVWEPGPSDRITSEIVEDSLKGLTGDADDLVVFGYRGALQHVVFDWRRWAASALGSSAGRPRCASRNWRFALPSVAATGHFRGRVGRDGRSRLPSLPTVADLDQVAAGAGERAVWRGWSRGGSREMPFEETWLPVPGDRPLRIVAWRNLSGDQTGWLAEALFRRGFRRFLAFGNAGGLGPRPAVASLWAPVVASQDRRHLRLRNQARVLWPGATITDVPSVLVETEDWLQRHRRFDLVDAETWYLAECQARHPELRLYVGLLVSDRPGVADISTRDEDSAEFVAAKRAFLTAGLGWAVSDRSWHRPNRAGRVRCGLAAQGAS